MFDRFQAIDLITVVTTTGDLNQVIGTGTTKSTVYADLSSVSRQEFLAAGTLGLKPSLVATVYAFEYSGQSIVKIDGRFYSVYRTYNHVEDDKIELYLEEKEGDKNEPSTSS